jgi:ARID/BRIGHT DNA binding domain
VNMGMQLPPPLEKTRFESAYKSWVATKNMKLDGRLMNVEGRQIDLYALHMNVMQEGGFNKVQNQELWSVIGGRMSFVQFPGNDVEPAKSGPGVAQRLAAVYKEYLLPFDTMYITSVIERRKQMHAAAAAVQAAAMASGSGGGGGPGPSSLGSMNAPNPNANNNSNPNMNPNMNPNNNLNSNNPANGNPNQNAIPNSNSNPNNPNTNNTNNPNTNNPNPNQGMGGMAGNMNMNMNIGMPPNPRALDPRTMQQVIGFANKSVTDLRQQGVSESIIAFVENNRAHLQRTVLEQGIFRGQLGGARGGGGGVGGEGMRGDQGMGPAGAGTGGMFAGPSGQGQSQGQGQGQPGGSRQPPPFTGQGKVMMPMQGGPGGGGFMGGPMLPQQSGPVASVRAPSHQNMQQFAAFVERTKVNYRQTREFFLWVIGIVDWMFFFFASRNAEYAVG